MCVQQGAKHDVCTAWCAKHGSICTHVKHQRIISHETNNYITVVSRVDAVTTINC